MGFLDKAKAKAEQAAAKAKEGVQDVQTKRELSQALGELGEIAFELVESGELEHARLTPVAERIRELKSRLEAEGGGDALVGAGVGASEPSDQPPAMPQ